MKRSYRLGLALAALGLLGWNLIAAEPDLTDYRTVDNAVTTRIAKAGLATASRPGFLGVLVAPDVQGRLAVAEVAADSPAAKAGLQPGDLLLRLNGWCAMANQAAAGRSISAPGRRRGWAGSNRR